MLVAWRVVPGRACKDSALNYCFLSCCFKSYSTLSYFDDRDDLVLINLQGH